MSESIKTSNTTGSRASSDSTVPPQKKGGFNQEQLIATVQTLQFGWFVGQFFTLIGTIFYLLTYVKIGGPKIATFWYILSLFGIVQSFGILTFQKLTKNGFQVGPITKDENTHYLFIGVAFLILRPYVLIQLIPFALFSVFHVLAYTESYLLPIFGIDSSSSVSKTIVGITSKYNSTSIQLASLIEIYGLGWLFLRLLAFRKNSLLPFIAYLVFIKIRFEHSHFTRNYLKSAEIQIDDLVNKLQQPVVKQVWVNVKEVLRRVGGIYLVNNYTKEKTT